MLILQVGKINNDAFEPEVWLNETEVNKNQYLKGLTLVKY